MLSVSNWLKNAEISEDLKLRTKGNKSSIFYVNRTVSHSCRLPLCRACLSQLDIRRGMGEVASQWVLCSQKSSLLVYPCVCVCVCVAGGMYPFPESQGRSSRVPKLSFLYFELWNFFSENCWCSKMLEKGAGEWRQIQEKECQESNLNLL